MRRKSMIRVSFSHHALHSIAMAADDVTMTRPVIGGDGLADGIKQRHERPAHWVDAQPS